MNELDNVNNKEKIISNNITIKSDSNDKKK